MSGVWTGVFLIQSSAAAVGETSNDGDWAESMQEEGDGLFRYLSASLSVSLSQILSCLLCLCLQFCKKTPEHIRLIKAVASNYRAIGSSNQVLYTLSNRKPRPLLHVRQNKKNTESQH